MKILGIESSCDESALAIFDSEIGIVFETVASQAELQSQYGGVVPAIASREHLDAFPLLLNDISHLLHEIDLIAVTIGPGLAGCLALGIAFAKSLALLLGKPIIGVNHLQAHALSVFIELFTQNPQNFLQRFPSYLPHLGLLVSGSNTTIFEISSDLQFCIHAQTRDDAAGEALDKGARLLGLPYPGGPYIESKAATGDPKKYSFPRAFIQSDPSAFSFSGLKTSLRYFLEKLNPLTLQQELANICASYQAAVIDTLVAKFAQALASNTPKSIGLSGGVSMNKSLRNAFTNLATQYSLSYFLALPKHTGDNAAMIAFAAYIYTLHPHLKVYQNLDFYPSLKL